MSEQSKQSKQWEVTYTTQNAGDGCKMTVRTGDGKTREITAENCEEVQAEVRQYINNSSGSGNVSTNQFRKGFFGIF